MSIRYLRTLIAVVEHGSFAAAAEVVSLTQSAVSQQMKALEEELCLELFDRGKRPLELSERGKTLVQKARQVVQLYAALKEESDVGQLESEGLLEIGALPTTLTGIVPQALVALRKSHPALQVKVVSGLSAELLVRVDRGDLDAALLSEPRPVPRSMLWRRVGDEPLMVIAPATAPDLDYRKLLGSLPFIRFNRRAWVGQGIQTAVQDMGIKVAEGMELDSLEAITQMVRLGFGVSVVPARCLEREAANGLKTVPFGSPPRIRTLGMLERREHIKSGLITALYKEMVIAASAEGCWDTGVPSEPARSCRQVRRLFPRRAG